MTKSARVLVAVAGLLGAVGALAQPYPVKPLRLVVPFPAGGPTDILGRLVGARLGEVFGQQVVIDNRGGGGGTIGATLSARAAPDGYTFYLGGVTTLAIAPSVHAALAYDPVRDFAPVTMATMQPVMLMVHPSLPVNGVNDLVALAAGVGHIHYATSGPGGSGHLAGELFKSVTKTDLNHVPYKGGSAALNDLVAGQVQVMFGTLLAAVPIVKTGKLRAVAVSGERRTVALPSVPTFLESGLANYEAGSWNGFVVPAGTPREVIARLNAEIVRILRTPNLLDRLAGDGVVATPGTPEEFGAYIRAELAKWGKVVREAKIRIE